MSLPRFYLAGPFFNVMQERYALAVRDLVKNASLPFYAPVEHKFQGDLHDRQKAREVFYANAEHIERSDVMLAHVDWLMPDDEEVRVCHQFTGHRLSKPLNIPDAGTVWEMGYAYRHKKQDPSMRIIAYTVKGNTPLNLMLAVSCDAYLQGWDMLTKFIKDVVVDGDVHAAMPLQAYEFTGRIV